MPLQPPTDDLLTRYLLQEVNAEEVASVEEWLAFDTSNRQYFEALEKAWLLSRFSDPADTINIDTEWAVFKQSITATNTTETLTSQPKVHPINEQQSAGKRKKVRLILTAVAVAASVLALVFLGKFLLPSKAPQRTIAATAHKPKDTTALVLRHEVNRTGKPEKLLLPDGTIVVLQAKSELRFTEPFAVTYRSVDLQGKASFKVAKDASRPFTVFSGAIATTVLGTVFDVSAYPQAGTITVRLYEGKVVVNAAPASPRKLKSSIYLSPGYELVYNKQNASASVHLFSSNPSASSPANNTGPSNIDNPTIPRKNGSWFMFNNQPLSQVFNQLQEMYKTPIMYNNKEVQKLYFIGQFNREDSITVILEQIARSNKLTLTHSNDTFIIKK